MLTVIQFLLFSLLVNVGYASSVCMADCSSQLTQGPSSLYEKYCCNTENSGRTFKLSENNKINFILCPSNLPTSCQRFVRSPINCSEIFRMNTSAVSRYYVFGGSSVYCDIVDYIKGLNFSDCYEIFKKKVLLHQVITQYKLLMVLSYQSIVIWRVVTVMVREAG